jgi:hypothetical protein
LKILSPSLACWLLGPLPLCVDEKKSALSNLRVYKKVKEAKEMESKSLTFLCS